MSDATLSTLAAPGWYGKLPHVGDFAARRLPDGFVRRWDRWLQRGLVSARGQLGERWLDAYLVAPIVRFWVAPGVLGEPGWAGLVMPSVDRVGRHFPLTIAHPLDALVAALAAREWFRALDTAARQVLDIEFSIDDLEQALGAVPAVDPLAADEAAKALAERVLRRPKAPEAGSLWWCGDAIDGAEFRCFAALPPAAAFASLIGGAR